MIEDDASAGETAAGYTGEFLDAAVAKIDGVFGEGYAKDNPELVGAYLVASATDLSAFMQAAGTMQSSGLGSISESMDPGLFADDEPPRKKKRR